jgi:hypothetical protein
MTGDESSTVEDVQLTRETLPCGHCPVVEHEVRLTMGCPVHSLLWEWLVGTDDSIKVEILPEALAKLVRTSQEAQALARENLDYQVAYAELRTANGRLRDDLSAIQDALYSPAEQLVGSGRVNLVGRARALRRHLADEETHSAELLDQVRRLERLTRQASPDRTQPFRPGSGSDCEVFDGSLWRQGTVVDVLTTEKGVTYRVDLGDHVHEVGDHAVRALSPFGPSSPTPHRALPRYPVSEQVEQEADRIAAAIEFYEWLGEQRWLRLSEEKAVTFVYQWLKIDPASLEQERRAMLGELRQRGGAH